jgi:hypothetical protein
MIIYSNYRQNGLLLIECPWSNGEKEHRRHDVFVKFSAGADHGVLVKTIRFLPVK